MAEWKDKPTKREQDRTTVLFHVRRGGRFSTQVIGN